MIEKYIKGVSEPKNRRLLRPSREITANTLMTYNFQTVQFRPLFAMYNYKLQRIMANISESAKKSAHIASWWKYLN
mgnify:CR=1 FL=1